MGFLGVVMTVDRRKLFALGGLGAIGASTGEFGPEVDPNYGASITIRVRRERTDSGGLEWAVLVPDFDARWMVGRYLPPVKWMPLNEWLSSVEEISSKYE